MSVVRCMLILALAWSQAIAFAANRHALLIGIGDYPDMAALEGPVNDVSLIRDTLISDWHFPADNVVTLINEQASKHGILTSIRGLGERAQRGDIALIYFSGHGTSAADATMPTSMPTKTGALVPHDASSAATAQELMQRLIIGKRDLRPLFDSLEALGLDVYVMIDACFSGNAVRDRTNPQTLPYRYLRFSSLMSADSSGNELKPRLKFAATNDYPYARLMSLSAAREYEAAQDIPASRLTQYPTIDGKPHGAFTDSLVRVMARYRDSARSDALPMDKLHHAVQALMRTRQFSSTPVLLSNARDGDVK